MSELACWNGAIGPLEDVRIPATDRGFLFGDSVYEMIRVYHGRPFLMEGHLDRLALSLAAIRINFPLETVVQEITRLLAQSQVQEGLIYIHITRGQAARKHVPTGLLGPNYLIYSQALPRELTLKKRQDGIKVGISRDLRHQLCHIKSTNLLANVLALMEADEKGYQEVLLMDEKGQIREGSHSNVAIIHKQTLITPSLNENILPGITRHYILNLAKQIGLMTREESFDRKKLLQADEIMMLGTTTEVMPVVEVDGHCIGNGLPGPWAKALGQAFDKSIG